MSDPIPLPVLLRALRRAVCEAQRLGLYHLNRGDQETARCYRDQLRAYRQQLKLWQALSLPGRSN